MSTEPSTTDIKYGVNASDRQLKLLKKNKIENFGQFLARPTQDLQKILKVSSAEILLTKRKIRGYNVRADYETAAADRGKNLAEYLEEASFKAEAIATGIPQLDELLPAGGVFSGDVIEICGRPGSGKTMLIFTIILKALESNENSEIIYFDTKNDFQAVKLKTMMIDQGISEEAQKSIFKRLFVKQVRSFDSLNSELRTMRRSQFVFDKVKIIVIDSICTLAYFTLGDGKMYIRRMLNATKLIKVLSGRNIAVSGSTVPATES